MEKFHGFWWIALIGDHMKLFQHNNTDIAITLLCEVGHHAIMNILSESQLSSTTKPWPIMLKFLPIMHLSTTSMLKNVTHYAQYYAQQLCHNSYTI